MHRATGAAAAFRYEPGTEQSIESTAKGYMAFCTALGQRPPLFDVATLSAYMVDWVVQGFTARSLGGNLSHLRTFARRLRARFPDAESQAWFEIKQLSTALIKVDPTKVSRATVVSLDIIRQILFHCGPFYDGRQTVRQTLFHLESLEREHLAHSIKRPRWPGQITCKIGFY